MGKRLSEMSLEELWQLFPILLTEHQPCWKVWYAEEAQLLKRALPAGTVVSHMGSTAVPGLWAKPIVDILAEIPADYGMAETKEAVLRCGYLCMAESAKGMSFNKGYTEQGFAEKVFHLHLRYAGDNDELYFRDWLLEHPEDAGEYERLKLELWKRFEHNRDGYTAAKQEIVQNYTEKAKILYKNRYSLPKIRKGDIAMPGKIDFTFHSETDGKKTWQLASGYIFETRILFAREQITAVVQAKGSVEFFDGEGGLVAAGSVSAMEDGREVYEDICCQVEDGCIVLQFPTYKWIDNYPNCDGEYDRWDKIVTGWRTLKLELCSGAVL